MCNYKVFVLDKDGEPLMPTTRFGKVRRMLKEGKAKVVTSKPFTIQLCYEPETHIVQDVILGIDPGRTNIGLAAVTEDSEALYSGKCTTKNKDVPKHMAKRKQHRMASRRGERKRRQRRAKRHNTAFAGAKVRERILPGCKKPIKNKYIVNTEARFLNRKREAGWLTPTATHLLRTHENLVDLVCKILPVNKVVLEINKFAFMAMDNPNIQRWEYQKGLLHGYGSVESAVSAQQECHCLLCKNPIEVYHHVVPQSRGGSNTLPNIVGLCEKCHTKVHKDAKFAEKVSKKKAGQNKKYGALSVLNQIIPKLTASLEKKFPGSVYVTNGRSTHAFREAHGIPKDHNTDAYCIACSILEEPKYVAAPKYAFEILQFRRHDRALTKAEHGRYYYLPQKNGKLLKVAVNRKKACSVDQLTGKETKQASDSLEDWFNKMVAKVGKEEAMRLRSSLVVKKSTRVKNNMGRRLPGAIFSYNNTNYVLRANHGDCVNAVGSDKEFPRKDVVFVAESSGLVYL